MAQVEQAQPSAPWVEPTTSHARARLSATVITHAVVDFFSFVIVPLLSVLEGRLDMTSTQGALLLAVGSLCSGLIQPAVAWLSDALDSRWLGTLGFLVAVVAIGLVGHARTFEQLLVIQAVGTAGIGAFHPVAAAATGHLSGRRRSLGVSIFYVSGMIGGIGGAFVTPIWAKHMGLPSISWWIAPGLVFVALLAWAIHSIPHRHADAHNHHAALPEEERLSRWRAVWLLYGANVVRFIVNMALVQLLVRWTEQAALRNAGATALTDELRTVASTINGPLQGAMAIGMAIAGLACGFFVRSHHEKALLTLIPAAAAGMVVAIPWAGDLGWTLGGQGGAVAIVFGLCMIAGCGYGGVVPVTISLAQRLLPHRTSLASGLMMGGAWFIAGVGPYAGQVAADALGLAWAFALTGGALAVSCFLTMLLPGRLLERIAVKPHDQ